MQFLHSAKAIVHQRSCRHVAIRFQVKLSALNQKLHHLELSGYALDYILCKQHSQRNSILVYANILQDCIFPEVKFVHAHIVNSKFVEQITYLENLLVNLYGKYGNLELAQFIFDRIVDPNIFSWNMIIGAYSQHGKVKNVFQIFKHMQPEGMQPDAFTFSRILSVCICPQALGDGKFIHAAIIHCGLDKDVVVCNAVVNMYGKCQNAAEAKSTFIRMTQWNVVSWNTILTICSQNEQDTQVLHLFEQMEMEGVRPNRVTFLSILNACANQGALYEGKVIHAYINTCQLELDIVVQTALINTYSKCGSIEDSSDVFDRMLVRNVFSWTAMISACIQNGHAKEALQIFQQMCLENIRPNDVTFATSLDACATLGAIENGKSMHIHIAETGFDKDVIVQNALINMYGKCGNVSSAAEIFANAHCKDFVSWTAMITAYAQNGHGKDALHLFKKMHLDGKRSDKITFMSILSGCNYASLLYEGCYYFTSMTGEHHLTPMIEHYGCIIDLLGKGSRLNQAEDWMNCMPFQADIMVSTTFLGACRVHGATNIVNNAAENALQLAARCSGAYALLANIYAEAGRWSGMNNVIEELEVEFDVQLASSRLLKPALNLAA